MGTPPLSLRLDLDSLRAPGVADGGEPAQPFPNSGAPHLLVSPVRRPAGSGILAPGQPGCPEAMADKAPTWTRDPYISCGFDAEGVLRACAHGLRLPASLAVSATPGNPGMASRVQALRAELDGQLLRPFKTAGDALSAALASSSAMRALLRAARGALAPGDDRLDALERDVTQVFGDASTAQPAEPSSNDAASLAAAVVEALAAGLGPGARLDELLLAARALLFTPPPAPGAVVASLPASASDVLRAGAGRLSSAAAALVAPSALALELQRDTGLTLRRALHHGLRAAPVASGAGIDPLAREARRSAEGFCTVGVLGAPVRSGAWYFEATVLMKELGQVRRGTAGVGRRWSARVAPLPRPSLPTPLL